MRDKWSIIIICAAICLLGLTYFISIYFSIPFGQLSKDPLSESGVNPIIGMLSNIGAVYWSMAAGICFFTFSIIFEKASRNQLSFILYSGMFSLLLLIDDLMMVHDKMVPYFLGIDELYVYILYAFLALFYLIYYKNNLLRTNYTILILALILFGVSILTDKLENYIDKSILYLIEDGTKFMGISFWLVYQYSVAKAMIKNYAESIK